MPLSSRELFARMLQCEAGGEGDNGMKAVASVIMNRVHVPYGEYMRVNQGNLRLVLLQPNQFTCAMTTVGGRANPQNIYNIPSDLVEYEVTDWALDGNKLFNIGDSLWYMNPFSPICPPEFPSAVGTNLNRIGQHCFYQPTAAYADT